MEHAAAHGKFQHRPPLFLRVPHRPQKVNIIKKGRLILHNQIAQHPGRLPNRLGVDIGLRRKAEHDLLPIGEAAAGLHKCVGQLAQVPEQLLLLLLPGKGVHIGHHPPVEPLQITHPLRQILRILLQILAVEGKKGAHAVHPVCGKVCGIHCVQQFFHLCQELLQTVHPAVVLNGVVGEDPAHGRPLPPRLRLPDLPLVDDIDRFHDVGHILRRHGGVLVVGDAGGHVLVGHVDVAVPRQLRCLLLVALVLEDLEGLLHQTDLLPRALEGPQRDVCPGAQDIPPGLRVLQLVVIFQIGGRLGKAQAHLDHEFLHQRQLQAHQLADAAMAAHPQPVQLLNHKVSVLQ